MEESLPATEQQPIEDQLELSTTLSLATAAAAMVLPPAKRKRLAPPHPQELPREYKDLVASKEGDVEGSLTLILGKRLTETDMNKHHNRLSMPQGQIKKSFLNPYEEELIHKKCPVGKRDLYQGISVTVVDPSMKERTMNLARWNSKKDDEEEKKSWWLALKKDWIKMAAENNLQEEEGIQIWSFRFKADRRLGFVQHKVLPPDEDDEHRRKKTKRTVGETSIRIASVQSRLKS